MFFVRFFSIHSALIAKTPGVGGASLGKESDDYARVMEQLDSGFACFLTSLLPYFVASFFRL